VVESLRTAVISWWHEPSATDPPRRVWRDWALVAVLEAAALLEGLFAPDVVWRPVALATSMALAPLLLWRRTHPLAVVLVAFGSLTALVLVGVVGDAGGPVGLYTNIFVLLLPYSLFRWGSGRAMALGTPVIAVTAAVAMIADWTGVGDAVGGALVLILSAVLGSTARYRETARIRELQQMKTSEREQLARELHDIVAHHVSAIAIRAQAGRVLASQDPQAALDALGVVEQQASQTLQELRSMVRVLRNGEGADLAPQRGVADIAALGRADDSVPVHVRVNGDLDDLSPGVGAALYRIAQESVTNALQHSHDATAVEVAVTGSPGSVHLEVTDDGRAIATGRRTAGYGLVGMNERATLLGGSLRAGPRRDGGWTVVADIPRNGAHP
jgi:signal transduction histidine kinase